MNISEEVIYRVFYYVDANKRNPVKTYIDNTSEKEQRKIYAHIEFLRENDGRLDEPYA